MTDKQKEIYKYILTYQKKYGEVPSCSVAGRHFGMTRQGMQVHYNVLQSHGFLKENEKVSFYRLGDNSLA
jgi:hypothetical protein